MKRRTLILLVVGMVICCCLTYPKNNNCVILKDTIIPYFNVDRDLTPFKKQFKDNRIVLIEDLFETTFFNHLQKKVLENEQFENRTADVFNSLRKAGTVNSSKISPTIVDLYYNSNFLKFLREITELPLENVNCDDKSNMNILIYDKPGDFISWHFDPNHYIGSRLTVLISIVNRSSSDSQSLSSSFLQYKLRGSKEIHSIQMKPNSILIFDGSQIEHRATGIRENEQRIVLSFTYCDICRETVIGNFVKRCKEMIMGY
jgi:hypothetical protein